MIYENLEFAPPTGRPFFYGNFVMTLDGKVAAGKNPKTYWPIGSSFDHDVLLHLRTYADVLLHGKSTARGFRTVDSLAQENFQQARLRRGIARELPYGIVSNPPDLSLLPAVKNNPGEKPLLITSQRADVPPEINELTSVQRLGNDRVDLNAVTELLYLQGHRVVLVEGGPKLFSSFLNAGLLDEIFITLSPKIIGSDTTTRTMVEGVIFLPTQVKNCTLLSAIPVENEIYLRYSIK